MASIQIAVEMQHDVECRCLQV